MFKFNEYWERFGLIIGLAASLILGGVEAAWCQRTNGTTGEVSTNQIVIQIPSGYIAGPELALVYNSDCGIRIEEGWSLTGLALIARDPACEPNYTENDRFLYNGEKLVRGEGGVYHLRHRKSQRFEVKNLNTASACWVMTGNNDLKVYFDGMTEAGGQKGKVDLWALSRMENTLGDNAIIEYQHNGNNGEYYPARITYNNHLIDSKLTIDFWYQSGKVHKTPDSDSASRDQNWRIEKILISENGKLLRDYRWYYKKDQTSNCSRVTGIKKYEYSDSEIQGVYINELADSGESSGELHEKNKLGERFRSGEWVWKSILVYLQIIFGIQIDLVYGLIP